MADRLDAQEVLSLDDFLNLSDEKDASEPDLSDIVDHGGDSTQDDEYISGPPQDLPSSAQLSTVCRMHFYGLSIKKAPLRRIFVR